MNYEDQVIEAAREGFANTFIRMDDKMENLLRLIYRAGYKQSQIDQLEQKRNEQTHTGI